MASENVRGKMISMYQLMALSASCWRFYPIQRSVIAVTARNVGGSCFTSSSADYSGGLLPNSPRWLAEKGRHIEAEEDCVCCAIRRKKREKNSTKFAKPEVKTGRLGTV